MASFCPTCGNTLYVKQARSFACRTCPYTFAIRSEISFPLALQRKQVDDVLGGAEAWENVDKTQGTFLSDAARWITRTGRFLLSEHTSLTHTCTDLPLASLVICPKCGCDYAYFMQIQTRSADEVRMA